MVSLCVHISVCVSICVRSLLILHYEMVCVKIYFAHIYIIILHAIKKYIHVHHVAYVYIYIYIYIYNMNKKNMCVYVCTHTYTHAHTLTYALKIDLQDSARLTFRHYGHYAAYAGLEIRLKK